MPDHPDVRAALPFLALADRYASASVRDHERLDDELRRLADVERPRQRAQGIGAAGVACANEPELGGDAAARHREAGLRATFATTHYAGDHWLPSFAGYLLTGRSAAAS